MEFIGTLITYLMMACCVASGISYIVNDQSKLGRAFQDGLHTMANMLTLICGLMASAPLPKIFISEVFRPIFALFGEDPVVAAAIVMPSGYGFFALATGIGQSIDLFPVIIAIGFMCVSTIAFNVPVGLSMPGKGDHEYLALGTMNGLLSVPFGVFITSVIMMFTHPAIRSTFSSMGEPDHVVMLTLGMLLRSIIPLMVIYVLLALGLKFFPDGIVKGFMVFGKLMTGALTLVVVVCIPRRYTGLFTDILSIGWGFDPVLADGKSTFRAVELLGTITIMLIGAFPMVTLIRRYLSKPPEKLGRLAGLGANGSVGLVACLPNGPAMSPFMKEMRPRDKVVYMAFLAYGGYSLGDSLAFNVSFQPNLLVPVFVRQTCDGAIGIVFAKLLAVPQVRTLEQETAVWDTRGRPFRSAPHVMVLRLGQQERAFIWMPTSSKFDATQALQNLDEPT